MLTADSEPASELLLRDTAISLDILRDYTRRLRAGQQLLILDACRNDARALGRSMESESLNAAMARDIRALAKDDRVRTKSGPQPCQLRSVSLADAEVLCAWMHRLDGRQYRVPTEAEWEYMARAGTGGRCWWEDSTVRDRSAAESRAANPPDRRLPAVSGCDGPRPADPSRANPWGLIDVLGTVWEWTASAYGPIAAATVLSAGGVLSGEARTVRGGSWRAQSPGELRVSARLSMCKRTRAGDLGVRLICEVQERSK